MSDVLQGIDPYTRPSFTLRNRCARLIWRIVWATLFRFSPQMCFGWRSQLLRLFGARIGCKCHVYNDVRIWAPWNLDMGDSASMGPGVTCYSMAMITLGARSVVSQGSHLCAGTHDYTRPDLPLMKPPITIQHQAWICADAFIGPGVTVGEGSVVGARAVVVKDVEPWTVVAGNPARYIKKRELDSN